MSTSSPAPIIRGERVWLRASERTDLPMFVDWLNDSETSTFLSTRAPFSLAAEEKWFERMLEHQGHDAYHFVICRLEDDQPIGVIGLFDVDTTDGNAGLGITIGEKSQWSQGFGSDALNALVDFGFGNLRMERIWLDVYDFNKRAQRSYEKCGFVLEGIRRHAAFRRGAYIDIHLMSILHDEWAALKRPRSWEFPSE